MCHQCTEESDHTCDFCRAPLCTEHAIPDDHSLAGHMCDTCATQIVAHNRLMESQGVLTFAR